MWAASNELQGHCQHSRPLTTCLEIIIKGTIPVQSCSVHLSASVQKSNDRTTLRKQGKHKHWLTADPWVSAQGHVRHQRAHHHSKELVGSSCAEITKEVRLATSSAHASELRASVPEKQVTPSSRYSHAINSKHKCQHASYRVLWMCHADTAPRESPPARSARCMHGRLVNAARSLHP